MPSPPSDAADAARDRLRELLHSDDPDIVAQGIELLVILADPLLIGEVLRTCRILSTGTLHGNRFFPGGPESDPFRAADLHSLLSLLPHIPPDAAVDPSLRPHHIRSLRLSVQPPLRLPPALSALPLEQLRLSRNHLETLPPDLPLLPPLQLLDLSHNALSALPLDPLAAALPRLTLLDLSFNPLSALPQAIQKLSGLQELRLVGTHLSSLPPALARLENLRVLDLSRCTALRALPPVVLALPRLEVLALRSVSLRLEVEQILAMPALRRLHISRGNYPRDAAEIRATLKEKRPELQVSL